jgi:hypothetical protein
MLFISYTSFSSVQNDLYTGTIQKLYNWNTKRFDLQGKVGQLLIHNGVPTNPSNNSKLAPLALAIKLFSPRDKNGLTNCHHVIIRIPFQHYSLTITTIVKYGQTLLLVKCIRLN